jgi:single-stranded DNA-binding protein
MCGTVAEPPRFSHTGGDNAERYLTFPLEIERLSGVVDKINVVAREADLAELELTGQSRLSVAGEIRSFNNKSGQGSRLVITVFAKELSFTDEPDSNTVTLTGALCKEPTLRKTPMGRQICDIMLAVNRRYGRSDYLPCIAWGRAAQALSERGTGETVSLTGRIQSRKYIKTTPDGAEERTAYEISVISLNNPA